MSRLPFYEGDLHQYNDGHAVQSPMGRTYDSAPPAPADVVIEDGMTNELGKPHVPNGFSFEGCGLGAAAELGISFNGAGPVPVKNERPHSEDIHFQYI